MKTSQACYENDVTNIFAKPSISFQEILREFIKEI